MGNQPVIDPDDGDKLRTANHTHAAERSNVIMGRSLLVAIIALGFTVIGASYYLATEIEANTSDMRWVKDGMTALKSGQEQTHKQLSEKVGITEHGELRDEIKSLDRAVRGDAGPPIMPGIAAELDEVKRLVRATGQTNINFLTSFEKRISNSLSPQAGQMTTSYSDSQSDLNMSMVQIAASRKALEENISEIRKILDTEEITSDRKQRLFELLDAQSNQFRACTQTVM